MKPQPLLHKNPDTPSDANYESWSADEIKAACTWTLGELLIRGEYNYSQVAYVLKKAIAPVYEEKEKQ